MTSKLPIIHTRIILSIGLVLCSSDVILGSGFFSIIVKECFHESSQLKLSLYNYTKQQIFLMVLYLSVKTLVCLRSVSCICVWERN
jgi:hypothetical protein